MRHAMEIQSIVKALYAWKCGGDLDELNVNEILEGKSNKWV